MTESYTKTVSDALKIAASSGKCGFNRVPIAAITGSIAGLPLTQELHYLSFESMRELAQGVAAVIYDLARLNSMQQAAYEKCNTDFDWSDRGRTLGNASGSCEPATC